VGRHENLGERAEAVSVRRAARGEQNRNVVSNHRVASPLQESVMNVNLSLAPLVALIAGIFILVMPRLLNYIVAIYLIITGLLGLFGGAGGSFHLR
jgi:Protein of unknown function (DUF3096)